MPVSAYRQPMRLPTEVPTTTSMGIFSRSSARITPTSAKPRPRRPRREADLRTHVPGGRPRGTVRESRAGAARKEDEGDAAQALPLAPRGAVRRISGSAVRHGGGSGSPAARAAS